MLAERRRGRVDKFRAGEFFITDGEQLRRNANLNMEEGGRRFGRETGRAKQERKHAPGFAWIARQRESGEGRQRPRVFGREDHAHLREVRQGGRDDFHAGLGS